MRSSTLQRRRAQLESLRRGLVGEVLELEEELRGLRPEDDVEEMDRVQREVFESALAGLDDSHRRQLEEAKAALERLDDGSYGKCQDCGKEIAAERLDAVPTARRCAACEDRLEAEERQRRES